MIGKSAKYGPKGGALGDGQDLDGETEVEGAQEREIGCQEVGRDQ
jgi:hypothetical protein